MLFGNALRENNNNLMGNSIKKMQKHWKRQPHDPTSGRFLASQDRGQREALEAYKVVKDVSAYRLVLCHATMLFCVDDWRSPNLNL